MPQVHIPLLELRVCWKNTLKCDGIIFKNTLKTQSRNAQTSNIKDPFFSNKQKCFLWSSLSPRKKILFRLFMDFFISTLLHAAPISLFPEVYCTEDIFKCTNQEEDVCLVMYLLCKGITTVLHFYIEMSSKCNFSVMLLGNDVTKALYTFHCEI